MQDLHMQLLEQGTDPGTLPSSDAVQASGSTTRSRGNTDDDVDPPQRVLPGQMGATDGNSEFEPLVKCLMSYAQAKPETSPEELAELRLQTKLLTERCRDLKAQLKNA